MFYFILSGLFTALEGGEDLTLQERHLILSVEDFQCARV